MPYLLGLTFQPKRMEEERRKEQKRANSRMWHSKYSKKGVPKNSAEPEVEEAAEPAAPAAGPGAPEAPAAAGDEWMANIPGQLMDQAGTPLTSQSTFSFSILDDKYKEILI